MIPRLYIRFTSHPLLVWSLMNTLFHLLEEGTYEATLAELEYLKYLGVTTIRLMGLTPRPCELGGEIDSRCWCM